MKRKSLSFREWTCIRSKELYGKRIESELFTGYIGLLDVHEVNEVQVWKFGGEEFIICDKGRKWLSILPKDDHYCITAMMDEDDKVLIWYIDMIASQGMDEDGFPYFDDLYLDLVVFPNGAVGVDDIDELEEALRKGDITQDQFDLAIETSDRLRNGLLSNFEDLVEYTKQCYEVVKA